MKLKRTVTRTLALGATAALISAAPASAASGTPASDATAAAVGAIPQAPQLPVPSIVPPDVIPGFSPGLVPLPRTPDVPLP